MASVLSGRRCAAGPFERAEAESDEAGRDDHVLADAEIFETVEFEYEVLRTRFQQMAFLGKVAGSTCDERADSTCEEGRDRSCCSSGTTASCTSADSWIAIEYLGKIRKAEHVNDEVIDFESEDTERRKIALEVAMQWTTRAAPRTSSRTEHDQHA